MTYLRNSTYCLLPVPVGSNNIYNWKIQSVCHEVNARHKVDIHRQIDNLTAYKEEVYYVGVKMYNKFA